MAGYLIAVNYKVLGVSAHMIIGVPNGEFPDQASAQAAAGTSATNYRASKGETITNVVTLVSATR